MSIHLTFMVEFGPRVHSIIQAIRQGHQSSQASTILTVKQTLSKRPENDERDG